MRYFLFMICLCLFLAFSSQIVGAADPAAPPLANPVAERAMDKNKQMSPQFETGALASNEIIEQMKKDFIDGKLVVDKTRLKDIRDIYGKPQSVIIDTDKKLSYDYNGVIKIDFQKDRYLRKWEIDSFRKPIYTDDANDLRYDLESQKDLVGDKVAFSDVSRTYGQPTESVQTDVDGQHSIYYYGNIKLTFENVYLVKKFQIKDIVPVNNHDVLESK